MLEFLKPTNINEKVDQHKNTQGAILLDVRTSEEYNEGHIEHSINIPVDQIDTIKTVTADTDTPIFVYCLSGGRATSAVRKLQKMGYRTVIHSGGIMSYHGKVVK